MVRHERSTGNKIVILIDSGATNNYINENSKVGKSIPLPRIIRTKTLHGISEIKSKRIINVLDNDLTFFEIKELIDYDMILGEQGLRQVKASINLFEYKIYYKKQIFSNKINYTNNCPDYEDLIKNIMVRNENISEKLPFTTTIKANIRTSNNEPVWSKQYPYPYSDKEFVDKEVKKLLRDDIIEKSHSPYNAPLWTVSKKGFDANGRPKRRLVIDFQKLNAHTITDRYPIPDINMTLQNLGNAKIFSVIDLESGFHQIPIDECDREKTAFSLNHDKYQFKRMPFGLKNAPSIFQRCVNDILSDFIGKFVYVYIDDVLIFSNSTEEHMKHISLVTDALYAANMKISEEKSHFFKTTIEYLGHVITHKKITVDPAKIATIRDYEVPKTLKQLRSFLGLTSYYRKFLKDYAKISKPLTIHLRDHGQVKANQSSKVKIELDEAALAAMQKVKLLLQEKVELYQPDFNKPFELTTDASNFAIGAVLSQDRHPITFISRTLSVTEQNYATNEKELLAIVWALQKLRNYLYGIADLTIYTDHQSLIYSISERNPNSKLKRWKNFIAEYGAELKYKPGHQNVVADALSRHQINLMPSSGSTVHSIVSSPTEKIKRVSFALNRFKNQIEITKTEINSFEAKTVFPSYHNYNIQFSSETELINNLKNCVSNKHLNAIFCTEETFYSIKTLIADIFINIKFVFTTNKVENITDANEQLRIVTEIHDRAHRNVNNNFIEAQRKYFWPEMKHNFSKKAKTCEICKTQKYERKPAKQPIGSTPVPTRTGQSIAMDLFHIDNKIYVTCIDRYSKYLQIHSIQTKTNFHEKLEEIITQNYQQCETIITDIEAIFTSSCSKAVFEKYKITHVTAPSRHSISNAQVERVHSTLIELSRCLAKENKSKPGEEIFNAVKQYNETIHSVTSEKPIDVHLNSHKYPNIAEKIKINQEKLLKYHNKDREERHFEPNEIIFVKSNRRRKDASSYTKHIVKEDRGDTVLTIGNKVFHKNSIRKNLK